MNLFFKLWASPILMTWALKRVSSIIKRPDQIYYWSTCILLRHRHIIETQIVGYIYIIGAWIYYGDIYKLLRYRTIDILLRHCYIIWSQIYYWGKYILLRHVYIIRAQIYFWGTYILVLWHGYYIGALEYYWGTEILLRHGNIVEAWIYCYGIYYWGTYIMDILLRHIYNNWGMYIMDILLRHIYNIIIIEARIIY